MRLFLRTTLTSVIKILISLWVVFYENVNIYFSHVVQKRNGPVTSVTQT